MSRNVILITVDSIRADHCGFMGYDRDTTPTLDALARDGVAFENAIAPAPYTVRSMPAVFTGRYPPRNTSGQGFDPRESVKSHLHRSDPIPLRLSEHGYSTAGFAPNPYTSHFFGFERGFDHFSDFFDASDDSRGKLRRAAESLNTAASRWARGKYVEGLRLGANEFGLSIPGFGSQSIRWESYYDMVLEWIAEASEPFFLWVLLLEPHSPYRPPRRYRNSIRFYEMYYYNLLRSNYSGEKPSDDVLRNLETLYDGAIRLADDFIGQLSGDVDHYDPVYIVHSDHGEAFGEHGQFGHTDYLYEENIHVPLVVGNVDGNAGVEEPISLRSLPDLVLALGTEAELEWHEYTRPWVISRARGKIAVRGRRWKCVRANSETALYDLASDSEEREDVRREYLDVGDNLRRLGQQADSNRTEKRRVLDAASAPVETGIL